MTERGQQQQRRGVRVRCVNKFDGGEHNRRAKWVDSELRQEDTCGTETPDSVNGIKMDVSRETAEDYLQMLQSLCLTKRAP